MPNSPQIVRQLEQVQVAVASHRVGSDDAPAARRGEDHDVRPSRQRLRGERGGRLERFLDRRRACDAVGAAGSVEDLVVGRQCTGVAGRRASASHSSVPVRSSSSTSPRGRSIGIRAGTTRVSFATTSSPRSSSGSSEKRRCRTAPVSRS